MKFINTICFLIAIPTLILGIIGAIYGWKGQLFLSSLLLTATPFFLNNQKITSALTST